jgi:hypothetical protein
MLLTAFSQLYSENQEQKSEWKRFEKHYFSQKGSEFEIVDKDMWLVKSLASLK